MSLRNSRIAAATLALAAAVGAQVGSSYTFAQTVGSYAPITGGTVLGTAMPANPLDDTTFAVSLPFVFLYDGTQQTTVQINTNGWIAFGAASPAANLSSPLSSTAVGPGFVAAFGRDLQGGFVFPGATALGSDQLTGSSSLGPVQVGDVLVGSGIPAGTTVASIAGTTITMSAAATATGNLAVNAFGPWSELRWQVQGSAPNRLFIAQWSNFRRFGTSLATVQEMVLNFQVRLHEDGRIQTCYGNCSPGVTTTPILGQVGLRGPTNAFPADVHCRQNVKGVSDWATSTPGTANNSGQFFNSVAPANVIPNGLTYEWLPPAGVVATNTTIGTGCTAPDSFYQVFGNASLAHFGLDDNVLSLNATPVGYAGTWLQGAASAQFVPPVAPTTLATGDDGVVTVTPSIPLSTPYGPQATLQVSGNGIVGFGAGVLNYPGTNSYAPAASGFLNSSCGGFYAWHDFNATEPGSGPVLSEEIGGTLYITYNGVENYASPEDSNPSTVQFQLDLAAGDVRIVWLQVDDDPSSVFGSVHLVGVSAPGASADSGPIGLATGPLLTTAPVSPPTLAALTRPQQLPALPNSWNLSATNLPVGIGAEIVGLTDPAITNLAVFGLGLSGCQLRATLELTSPFVAGGPHLWSIVIPGGAPALNGVELFVQTAVLDVAGNLAISQTTNGIKGRIGNL